MLYFIYRGIQIIFARDVNFYLLLILQGWDLWREPMDLNNVAWACFKFIILHIWPSIVFFILLTIVSKIYKFKSSWKSLYEEYVHFKPFPRPTLGLQIYKCSTKFTIYSQSIKFSKKYCRIFTPNQVKSTFSKKFTLSSSC